MTDLPVVAFVDDLMDRSRIAASLDGVVFARTVEEAAAAGVVVVDLARHADLVAILRGRSPALPILAFGPHVDVEGAARALRDGADTVLPRSELFADPATAIQAVLARSSTRPPA